MADELVGLLCNGKNMQAAYIATATTTPESLHAPRHFRQSNNNAQSNISTTETQLFPTEYCYTVLIDTHSTLSDLNGKH